MAASSVTGVSGAGSASDKNPYRAITAFEIVAAGNATLNGGGNFSIDLEDWEIDISHGELQFFATASGIGNVIVNFGGWGFGVRHGLTTSILGVIDFVGSTPGANFAWMVTQKKAR